MEKHKPAKPMPNPINRGRGRMGRLRGPQNLQKLGVAFREAKSVNNNLIKRCRGRPRGTGQLEQQFEVRKSARLVQPTESRLLAGTCNVSEEMVPSGAPLQWCSSAQVLINSPTESSAIPSTCTEPLTGDYGVISKHGVKAVNPSMEKQKPAKPMPNLINRGRGRIGRLRSPRNLQKLGAGFREAKSVNNNQIKRCRGRPRGTGQLEQQFEVRKSARLVQPTEPRLLAGTCTVSEKEEMVPSGAPLQWCSSAQVLINSPTESSAIPSTCTEPLTRDNGVISKHGVKGEKPGASQEQRRINPHPLPGGGQCSSKDNTKSYTMLSGGLVQNDFGSCLNSEDMSRAQLRVLETGAGQLQPNIVIVSGLLAVNPSMEKQKPAKPMPNLINHCRGRTGCLRGPRKLQKLGVSFREARFVNNNLTKRCRGRPRDTAQMNAALQSDINYFHRPFTRSQAKVLSNTSMFPEEAPQQKPISEGDVLCNGSEQIPDLDMGTFLVSDSKKMMLGGGSSVETMQVESSGENPYWLRTHSNLEENDIISGTQIEDIVAGASGGSVSKTGENSGIHLDLQPTEGQSQSNTSHCENDCPYDADLSSIMSETSLLQTIYTKYGDITQSCDRSETFKKSCLLGICEVIQKLQVTSIDDISSDDMAELYSTVKDAENLKLDVKWLHQRLVEIEESMRSRDKLKTMEEAEGAITLEEEKLRKRLAMNKLKIARLEHEIEMLREEQTAKKSRCEEVKARTENIKSAYHSCPKYLIDWLL